jgi:GDP-L-fucose synthase
LRALKVLITGAAGMLGSNLLSVISRLEDAEVIGLTRSDLDLRDQKAFESILTSQKPEIVIHAAAKVGGIQANIKNPYDFLASNLSMDTNVIQSSLNAGIKNLIYIGSSCMYPKDYRQPLIERDILAAPLEPTNEGYAIAKIAGSKMCEFASSSLGVNYKTIVPSNLYGPGDNFNPGSSHLLASVIRKVHEAKEAQLSSIEVWGSGSARREFTYVTDLASWISGSLGDIGSLPSVLNLGIGVDYSIDEFYIAAMEALNYRVPLVHDKSKPEGMMAKLMDSSLATNSHGWNPATDLLTGITQTFEWFIKSQESIARV